MPLRVGCLGGVEDSLGSASLSVPGLITRHAEEEQAPPQPRGQSFPPEQRGACAGRSHSPDRGANA